MLKLVLDTNIIISAFFWQGNEAELFRKIEQRKAFLFISPAIMEEVEQVINRPKFKQIIIKANLSLGQIIQKIVSVAHLVIGLKLNIDVIKKDLADNKILECAVQAKVDYVISGDKHLLDLKEYKGIKVVKAKEILDLL